jgi:4'-phosphopantetheinyl transferase EntD
MLKSILPPGVALHEGAIGEVAAELWSQEAALCADAVDKRRREFAAGRALARRALAELGAPEGPLLAVSGGRAPAWPAGYVGSITHTGDHAAAAVARIEAFAGLGIDLEDWGRFRVRLEAAILTPDEIARELSGLDGAARQTTAALLFSAKESFYKCQHPLTGVRLGFQDAQVELDAASAAFRLTLLRDAAPLAAGRVFEGRCAVAGARVATAVWIAR